MMVLKKSLHSLYKNWEAEIFYSASFFLVVEICISFSFFVNLLQIRKIC